MKHAIRCCCEPAKVMGYIDLPYGSLGVLFFERRDGQELIEHRASIRFFINAKGERERAVLSSHDRTVDFWRMHPKFIEAEADDGSAS